MENCIKLTCLVLEPVAIVADDLLTMVEEDMPGTRMLVAPTADMAANILRNDRVDIAFLNLSPVALAQTDLVKMLDAMSATVVLMGHETEDIPPNLRFLELPFVSSAVAQELQLALQRLLGFGAEMEGKPRR